MDIEELSARVFELEERVHRLEFPLDTPARDRDATRAPTPEERRRAQQAEKEAQRELDAEEARAAAEAENTGEKPQE